MTDPYRDQRYYPHPLPRPHPSQQLQTQGPYPVQQIQYNGYPGYYQQPQQQLAASFPLYPTQTSYPAYSYSHGHQLAPVAQPRRSDRGRDYLASLTTSVSNLHLQPVIDKPLPRLPPSVVSERQPIASSSQHTSRPASLPSYAESIPPLPTPPAVPPRPTTQIQARPRTPPTTTASPVRKSFTPSFHPHHSGSQDELLRPPELTRPKSDSVIPTSTFRARKGKGRAEDTEVYDLTVDSDNDDELSPSPSDRQRRRAISDMPRTSPSKAGTATPRTPTKISRSPVKPKPLASPSSPNAVRCSGYTRSGQPCKRVVRSTAPYLLSRDINIGEGEDGSLVKEERYCKDHAGRICQVGGFYWRGGAKSVWVDFGEFIPDTLGQQTQTLLRTTMESRLTDKDLPGFLYAYELRDLQTPRVSFFKVGRTDNVPRRMSEWSSQCRSHTPTLRDIFPRRPHLKTAISRIADGAASDLHRRTTGSYLPGAFHSGNNNDDSRPRIAAMKRWERLVHLELADLSSTDCEQEWKGVREKCSDCGSVHKEIFPIMRSGREGDEYAKVVEVIGRWAAFVNMICSDAS